MKLRTWIVPGIVVITASLLLVTVSGCWPRWTSEAAEQTTDDAYVHADLTPLSTRISGTVRSVEVNDYQAVQPGQLVIQLDDDDYRADLDQANAALAAARAEYAENQAAKTVQDARVRSAESGVAEAVAAVRAAQAAVAASRPDVVRTTEELARQKALIASKAATQQQLESAVADAGRFTGMLDSRQADLEKAQAALESARTALDAEQRERSALDVHDELIRADIQAKQAAITVAAVNLGYTKILAPAAGAVGERHVQVGQLVAPGMDLIDLVEGDVWILANYKETQLTRVRVGDGADIRVDTFPGVKLHGHVAEIAPASGSQFALLPPDNATGNFTKVVQRIPVKIVLDANHPLQGQLRPGFSAEVTIHVRAASKGHRS